MNTFTDYYFRFDNETEAKATLSEFTRPDPVTGAPAWETAGDDFALDPIGALYVGEEEIEGWHVNLRVLAGSTRTIPSFGRVTPDNVLRRWAG